MGRLTPYRIRSTAEETSCDWCGFPLYVGDSATLKADSVFCSPACADRYREALALRRDDEAAHAFGSPID